MKNRFFCLFLLFVISLNSFSIGNRTSGARSLALSNAFVSISDTWSTFHNQAGLADFENITTGVFFESKFMIEELSHAAGSFVLPVNSGVFGLSYSQFGKASYKENKVGLAFSKQLTANLNAGVQLDYFSQTLPENDREKGLAAFEAGLIYSPNKTLHLGAHIFNPISAGKQKMPTILRLGGHYQFDENLLFIAETQKESNTPIQVKTGLEFAPAQNLFLRFGVSGKPVNYTAGIGYRIGKVTTDIAFSYHGILGITPSISIQFEI